MICRIYKYAVEINLPYSPHAPNMDKISNWTAIRIDAHPEIIFEDNDSRLAHEFFRESKLDSSEVVGFKSTTGYIVRLTEYLLAEFEDEEDDCGRIVKYSTIPHNTTITLFGDEKWVYDADEEEWTKIEEEE